MLLGVLREGDAVAATSLTNYGITVEGAREHIVHSRTSDSPPTTAEPGTAAAAARELTWIYIQRIMSLVRDLERAERNSTHAHTLVERIHDELMVLGELWK
jgi:hypothetical protein